MQDVTKISNRRVCPRRRQNSYGFRTNKKTQHNQTQHNTKKEGEQPVVQLEVPGGQKE